MDRTHLCENVIVNVNIGDVMFAVSDLRPYHIIIILLK